MRHDPWVERFLRRPDVRARLHLFIRLVQFSSYLALAAGILLLVMFFAAGME
jgi:hypothetical protein